ncbi:MAG: serine protease Do [Chloroflexota bacterium]|nr:serine protease Do [Chloroflexota bacterium]
MRIARILGIVLVAAVVAAAVSTVVVLNRRSPDQVGRGPLVQGGAGDSALAAVQKAEPSVVRIDRSAPGATLSPGLTPSPGAGTASPSPAAAVTGGTGVVVDARGYILTAEALVAGAQALSVAVPGGRTVPARVVGSDPVFALTLLKVDANNLHALSSSGTSALGDGAGIVVLAAPPYAQVAVGAVASAHASAAIADPSNPEQRRVLNDILGLDVASRDGQLGAPLLDASGRLAGLVVATGPQLYAIDMSQAQADVQQLVDAGHVSYPTLGFEYQQLSVSEAADHDVPGGVLVIGVGNATAAAQAGLGLGDVVISAAGTTLDPTHPLQRLLRGMAVRQQVPLVVKTGSARRNISLDVQLVSP